MERFLDRSGEFGAELAKITLAEVASSGDEAHQESGEQDVSQGQDYAQEGLVLRSMDFRMAGIRIFLPDDFCNMSVSACKEICEGTVTDGEIYMVDINPVTAAHFSTADILASENRYSRFGWKFTPFILDKSCRTIRRMGSIWPVFKRILFCPECGIEKEYTHHEINVLRKQTKSIFLECGVCKESGKAVQLKVRTYRPKLSDEDRHVFQFLAIEMRKSAMNNERIFPRVYAVYPKVDAPQVQWAPSDKEEEDLYKRAEAKGRVIAPIGLCMASGKRMEDIRITVKSFQAGWSYKREFFREFCVEKYGWSRAFKALRFSKFGKKPCEEEL